MALVRDDEVECLNRDVWVVRDGRWLALQSLQRESGLFFKRRVKLLLSLEHRVEALNCGDADLADLVQLVGLKMLDVVKLGEEALFFWSAEILELF